MQNTTTIEQHKINGAKVFSAVCRALPKGAESRNQVRAAALKAAADCGLTGYDANWAASNALAGMGYGGGL